MSKPIDPTDVDALGDIDRAARKWFWIEVSPTLDDCIEVDTRMMVADDCARWAVARAVCPEHHAVYDTRTHVAVPVETLRRVLDSHDMRCGDDADIDALHSLIPTEATDE